MDFDFPTYTHGERLADNIVHIIGITASISAAIVLWVLGSIYQNTWSVLALVIYGLGTVAVFCLSAAYNMWRPSYTKLILRRFDRAAIFVKIAATYTPFAAICIGGAWGITLLTSVWLIALVAVPLTLFFSSRLKRFVVSLCLVQGWIGVLAIHPLSQSLSTTDFSLLAAGAILYTLGVVFFLAEQLKFANAIWHVFVLSASTCMYIAILKSVALA